MQVVLAARRRTVRITGGDETVRRVKLREVNGSIISVGFLCLWFGFQKCTTNDSVYEDIRLIRLRV